MLLLTITFVLLAVKYFIFLWKKRRVIMFCKSIKNNLRSYPLIGHAPYVMGDSEKRMSAFHLFGRESIKQGGLTKLIALNKYFLVVGDAEIADVIFKSCLEKADVMDVAKNLIGNGSTSAPVAIWRPRRKILAPAFKHRNVIEFVQIFDKCSRRMIEQLQKYVGKESFSIWKYISAFEMDSVCATVLGVDMDIHSNTDIPFINAFEKYCEMTSHRLCSPWLHDDTIYEMIPWYAVIKKHITLMWTFVDDIIITKRNEERNKAAGDFSDSEQTNAIIEFLVKLKGDTGYTDLELREELLVVILAGTDTSATGAAFVLSMLSKSSSLRERVQAEIREVFGYSDRAVTAEDLQKLKFLEAVVKETLRLYPPVPVIARTTDRDVTLPTGQVIPRNCDILLNLWAIQRNPRFWGSDAEEFKPERFLDDKEHHHAAFVAFSYGPRKCLGNQYGMMSIKTVVCNLLRNFTIRHPDRDEPVEAINDPMRVKFEVMMKDVHNWRIRLDKVY